MHTPILETERLILRPLTVADADEAFRNWTSDPEVPRYMRWVVHESLEDTLAWLRETEQHLESDDNYTWGLELKSTGELIGSGGLYPCEEDEQGTLELGYNIMRLRWGQGLTTEAMQTIVDFALHSLGVPGLIAYYAPANAASGRVLEKLGFTYVRYLPACPGTDKGLDGNECRLKGLGTHQKGTHA